MVGKMLASLSAFCLFCCLLTPQICLCAAAWLNEVMENAVGRRAGRNPPY